MENGRCGASCAASSAIRAPRRRATAASSATGHNSPVTFDAPVITSSAGPGGAAPQRVVDRGDRVRGGVSGAGSRIDRRSAGHGSSAAWCSVSNTTTVVAGGQAVREQVERVGGVAG